MDCRVGTNVDGQQIELGKLRLSLGVHDSARCRIESTRDLNPDYLMVAKNSKIARARSAHRSEHFVSTFEQVSTH